MVSYQKTGVKIEQEIEEDFENEKKNEKNRGSFKCGSSGSQSCSRMWQRIRQQQ